MVEYKCNKCNKIYENKYNYNKHINRKFPCESALSDIAKPELILENPTHIPHNPTQNSEKTEYIINKETSENFDCKYCSQKFSRKDALVRHIDKFCKVKKGKDAEDKDTLQKLLLEFEQQKKAFEIFKQESEKKQIALNNENQKFKKKITTLETQIKKSGNNITNIDKQQVNNVDKQINNNNNNIKLIAFGEEDLSYITDNVCKEILKKGFQSYPKLIEHMHFSEDKPEYHNVFISNLRTDKAMAYDGSNWNLQERDDVFDTLRAMSYEFIDNKFKEFQEKGELSEATITKLKRFISERDDEDKIATSNDDIKMLLYNKRNIVNKTIKKIKEQEKKQLEA
jgi:hypothetical protein